MRVNPLETYLTELREIRDSGAATKETSGYGTLAKLLDAVGHSLKPKVHCIIQLKNSGAGFPDGGLFTPDQLRNTDEEAPLRLREASLGTQGSRRSLTWSGIPAGCNRIVVLARLAGYSLPTLPGEWHLHSA